MSRLARQISQTGLYHVVFRGVNRQHLFEEDEDYKKLQMILEILKNEMQFEIYAYCLMSNHVHILLKEKISGDISLIMKRLLTKYARWYNTKYSRSGALIANRYKSQPVNVDEYLWSSYVEYTSEKEGITDKSFIMELMPKDIFIEFHQQEEEEIFEISDKKKMDKGSIRRAIIKKIGKEPHEIGRLTKTERNQILQELKKEYSIRQLERVTGISRGIIAKT